MQEVCVRRMMDCPNKCRARLEFRNVQQHVDRDCPRRKVPCSLGCGVMVDYESRREHRLTVCQKREVRCKLGCGKVMLAEFPGWRAAIFTSELELGKATGLRSHKRYALYNGAIATYLLLFDLSHNELRDTSNGESAEEGAAAQPLGASPPQQESAATSEVPEHLMALLQQQMRAM